MKLNLRRTLISWLLIVIPLENIFNDTNVGFSYTKDITHNTVSVSAMTHPGLILWALVCIFLFALLMRKNEKVENLQIASLWRRFGALLLDFIYFVVPVSALLSLVPLFVEAQRMGHFQWWFQRDYAVSTDSIMSALAFLIFILMILYFTYPLTRGKASVGSYILGLSVTKDGKSVQLSWTEALKRTLWQFLGICVWPYTMIKGKDKEGRTWYDRKSGCQVLRCLEDKSADKGIDLVWYFVLGLFICGMGYTFANYIEPQFTQIHWRVYSFDPYHFSVESPVLLPKDKQDYEREQLDNDEIKYLSISRDLGETVLSVESSEYRSKILSKNIDQFYKKCVSEFQADRDIKNLKTNIQKMTYQGMSAIQVTSTYNVQGSDPLHEMPIQSKMLIVYNRNWDWILNVRCERNDEDIANADRIFQSLKIEKF